MKYVLKDCMGYILVIKNEVVYIPFIHCHYQFNLIPMGIVGSNGLS